MPASDLIIILMTAIGASSTVVAKFLLHSTPPFTLMFFRFFLAAIFLLILRAKTIRSHFFESWKAGVLIGLSWGMGCMFLYQGMQHVESGHAAFIINIEVAIVPLLVFLLFKTKPATLEVIGIVLALIGLWFFTGAKISSISRSDWILLLSATSYAFYTIALSHLSKQGSLSARIFVALITISLISGTVSLLTETPSFAQWDGSHVLWFAYFVIVATVVRLIGQSWGQARTSATRTALIFTLEPMFTLILSNLLFGESFAPHQYIGGALLLSASLLSSITRPEEKDAAIP